MNPFGSLGGLGGHPMRSTMPNSQEVTASPFADWGGPQAWQQDWQQRYDAEMAKPVAPVETADVWGTQNVSIIPGARGYNPSLARPYHDEIRQQMGDAAFNQSIYATGGTEGNHLIPMRVRTGTQTYTPSGDWRNIDPLYQERDRMQPLMEGPLRQQQAYDWMEGGNQQNARMSGDYTNPGFGQVTGQMNPFGPSAGPAANMAGGGGGIDSGWSQGVYDPNSQQQPGVFQPGQNARRGW